LFQPAASHGGGLLLAKALAPLTSAPWSHWGQVWIVAAALPLSEKPAGDAPEPI